MKHCGNIIKISASDLEGAKNLFGILLRQRANSPEVLLKQDSTG